jgi:hypothetical protein
MMNLSTTRRPTTTDDDKKTTVPPSLFVPGLELVLLAALGFGHLVAASHRLANPLTLEDVVAGRRRRRELHVPI